MSRSSIQHGWLRHSVLALLCLPLGLAPATSVAQTKLGKNCTATLLNRTVQLDAKGGFAIPNVPVDSGLFRVRIICKQPDGSSTTAQSGLLKLVPNGRTVIGQIDSKTIT